MSWRCNSVNEPNISAWRRSICGDLTSCFDFAAPRFIIPMLPDTTALRRQADDSQTKLPPPTPPLPGQQIVPVQDAGSARARALPYQPMANLEISGGQLVVHMSNHGQNTLQLSVYAHHALSDTAQRFDLHHGGTATATVAPEPITESYDVEIHGPNGFLRTAAGSLLSPEAGVEAALTLAGGGNNPTLKLMLRNHSKRALTLRVSGLHSNPARFELAPRGTETVALDPLANNHGWYDLVVSVEGQSTFTRRFAGHLENGEPSRTGPA
jgi:phospholipase C